MKKRDQDLFKNFEDDPLEVKFMGGMCTSGTFYSEYRKSYKVTLKAVRKAVHEGTMSEEDGRRLLIQCQRGS